MAMSRCLPVTDDAYVTIPAWVGEEAWTRGWPPPGRRPAHGRDVRRDATISLDDLLESMVPAWGWANEIDGTGAYVHAEARHALQLLWSAVLENVAQRQGQRRPVMGVLNVDMVRRS